MSEERIVGSMEFVQMNRWGSWRSDAPGLPPVSRLLDQSSNVQVIPANATDRGSGACELVFVTRVARLPLE